MFSLSFILPNESILEIRAAPSIRIWDILLLGRRSTTELERLGTGGRN
jgi:hypothetical protein